MGLVKITLCFSLSANAMAYLHGGDRGYISKLSEIYVVVLFASLILFGVTVVYNLYQFSKIVSLGDNLYVMPIQHKNLFPQSELMS